jgi:hypothetical protein
MYTLGGCGTDLAPAPIAEPGGLGCVDCGGTCGGCGMSGLTMDGSGLFGTGIFGTGVTVSDPSTWGIGEWGAVGVIAFAMLSMFDTGRRTVHATRRKTRAVRKALAR